MLPATTPQCGLITKSDGERLCSYLLIKQTPAKPSSSPPATVSEDAVAVSSPPESGCSPPRIRVGSPGRVGVISPDLASTFCVRVQHNCFGKCVGSLDVSKAGEEVQGSTQSNPCIGKKNLYKFSVIHFFHFFQSRFLHIIIKLNCDIFFLIS